MISKEGLSKRIEILEGEGQKAPHVHIIKDTDYPSPEAAREVLEALEREAPDDIFVYVRRV